MKLSKKLFERLLHYSHPSLSPEQVVSYLIIRYMDLNPTKGNGVSVDISGEVEKAVGKYFLNKYGNGIVKKMLMVMEKEMEKREREREMESDGFVLH